VTDDDFVFCDDGGEPLCKRHVTTRECSAAPASGRAAADPLPRPARHLRHPAAGGRHQPQDRVRGARHKDVAITPTATATPCPPCWSRPWAVSTQSSADALLDAPDVGEDEAPAPNLWLGDEPGASPDAPRTGHKGSHKGSYYGLPRESGHEETRCELRSGRK
jgi:hypothetical protein